MKTKQKSRAAVVISKNRNRFVEKSINDLISDSNGRIRRADTWPEGEVDIIIAGNITAHKNRITIPNEYDRIYRHPQAYLLAPLKHGKQDVLMVAGSDDLGLGYGIKECHYRLSVAGDIRRIDKHFCYPLIQKRGIYAHQHWAYNYPYAMRSWKFTDWKNYLDILSLFKINLFLIWPAACVLPMPLSREDRQYLAGYEKIVDYAKRDCGMEVILGEPPNSIARKGRGRMPPVAKRRYFDYEVLVDPKSKEFDEEIIENRKLMYRLAGDADGYVTIDSDPGGYPGSSVSDFVDIFIKNRKAIDESSPEGKHKWLYYWMWLGWGELQNDPDNIQFDRKEAWQDTIKGLRAKLSEPWGLFACWEKHLDLVKKEGLLSRTLYFPYGAVEGEPNGPYTEMRCADIDVSLDMVKSYASQLRGIMCNVQTPFVQLPNIFYFQKRLWSGSRGPEKTEEILKECALLFSRSRSRTLFEGWNALRLLDPERLQSARRNLRKSKNLKLDGIAGKFLKRSKCDLSGDLKDSVLIHLKERELIGVLDHYDDRKEKKFRTGLINFMNANIVTARKTGFTENNFYSWRSLERIRPYLKSINFRKITEVFNTVQNSFCRGRDEKLKEMAIEFLRSRLKIFKYY